LVAHGHEGPKLIDGDDGKTAVIALLASDRGKFLTGANYGVDGGMTAR
jgi:hypothetical protein